LSLAFETAERNNIGLYDAHYLLLALEVGGRLATKDSGLLVAAALFGVDVIDVR
jgi:predicted nucleic acid-binding protein